ncbi:MAG: hypothetical protein KC609_08650 [Myxococcales bacterium]|nr:hypothetical protein [Myxococcales bacterium]
MDQNQYTCQNCGEEWYFSDEKASKFGGNSMLSMISYCPSCKPQMQRDRTQRGFDDDLEGTEGEWETGEAAGAASDEEFVDDDRYDGGDDDDYVDDDSPRRRKDDGFWGDDD